MRSSALDALDVSRRMVHFRPCCPNLPQTHLPIPGRINIPIGQWLHPPFQPWPLHHEASKVDSRHDAFGVCLDKGAMLLGRIEFCLSRPFLMHYIDTEPDPRLIYPTARQSSLFPRVRQPRAPQTCGSFNNVSSQFRTTAPPVRVLIPTISQRIFTQVQLKGTLLISYASSLSPVSHEKTQQLSSNLQHHCGVAMGS